MTPAKLVGAKVTRFVSVLSVGMATACAVVSGYVVGNGVATRVRQSPFARQPVVTRLSDFTNTGTVGLENIGKAVVFVTESRCAFCTASMPFYERLIALAAASGTRVLFATPEPVTTNRTYLRDNGVLHQTPILLEELDLSVRGTPTVLVLEGRTIKRAWLGKLTAEQEAEVTDAIQ
jgi:hypothetical protein